MFGGKLSIEMASNVVIEDQCDSEIEEVISYTIKIDKS
jgi:hypothetical protein